MQYGIYVIYKLPNAVELQQRDSESRWGTDMIKAVIFDMDGTMFDTECLSTKGWIYAGKKLGVDIPIALTDSFRGRNPQ